MKPCLIKGRCTSRWYDARIASETRRASGEGVSRHWEARSGTVGEVCQPRCVAAADRPGGREFISRRRPVRSPRPIATMYARRGAPPSPGVGFAAIMRISRAVAECRAEGVVGAGQFSIVAARVVHREPGSRRPPAGGGAVGGGDSWRLLTPGGIHRERFTEPFGKGCRDCVAWDRSAASRCMTGRLRVGGQTSARYFGAAHHGGSVIAERRSEACGSR